MTAGGGATTTTHMPAIAARADAESIANATGMDTLLDEALGRGALRIRPFRFSLADAGVSLADVLAHPRVGRLHTLEVARQDLPPSAIDALLAWHGLEGLRSLALHINELGREGLLRLLRSPKLAQLRSLEMHGAEGNDVADDEGARFVADLMHRVPLPHLRRLRFGCHGGAEAAGRAIGTYTGFPRLVALDYALAPGSAPAIVDGLVSTGRLATLRYLGLDGTTFDDACLRRVLASGMSQGLQTLTIRLADLRTDGIAPLGHARGKLSSLRQLVMSNGRAQKPSLIELAKMDAPRLRWLDIMSVSFDAANLAALAKAAFWPQMLGVSMDGVPFDFDAVQRLLLDPRSAGIRRLRLNGVTFDRDALTLFRERPGVLSEVMRHWQRQSEGDPISPRRAELHGHVC